MNDRQLTLVATDSYRLHFARLRLKGLRGKGASSMAPARLWRLVAAGKGETLLYAKNADGVHVVVDGLLIHMAEVSGAFPAWEKLIPVEHAHECSIDSDVLSRCCASAAKLKARNAPLVISPQGEDVLRMAMMEDQRVVVTTDVPSTRHGLTRVYGYNPAYLLDAVRCSAESGETQMAVSSPLSPAMVTGGSDVACLVMPMLVHEDRWITDAKRSDIACDTAAEESFARSAALEMSAAAEA